MILLTLFLLAVMEVSLSFDNAVVNASVLQSLPALWQRRFLTWGMLVAVVGMRLIFPILIVSLATSLPLFSVLEIAVKAPEIYASHLANAHVAISSFGGIFLMMLFLKFMIDKDKEIHWIKIIEEKLSNLANIESIEICVILGLILVLQTFVPLEDRLAFQVAGIFSVIVYTFLNGVMGGGHGKIPRNPFMAFLYLEFIDASCSFDGVIGAFVLTNNIILIMIGLGIGALAIRSLTLYLVRGGVIKEYIYLEHGAHYGIGALAAIMLTDIFYPVPEPITGMVGMSFIGFSLLSSIKHNRSKR